MSGKNEVAKAQNTSVSTEVNNDLFGEYAGEGLENVGAKDVLIPRLGIAQALSPQLNKKKPEYIEGTEIGDIIDIGTGDLFKEGIVFLPVFYRKDYLEWAPRESGNGLQGVHSDPAILDECTQNENKQMVLPNGNIIIETAQFYGLNITAGRRPSFIPLASTALKVARRWNTLAAGEKLQRADGSEFTAPLFYRSYNLTTAEESNNKGDWSTWRVERGQTLVELAEEFGLNASDLLAQCKKFKDDIMGDAVKADLASMNEGTGGSGGADHDPDAAM